MTNLSDFLKVKKMRCVKAYGDCLTVGKEYGVIDIRMEVKVKDDEGDNYYWESDHFEPIPNQAENPLRNAELTPEFEAVAPHVSPPSNDGATYVSEPYNDVLFPRFEVGQKAYCPWLNDGELVTLGLDDNGDLIAQTKKGLQAFDCEGYALDCTPRQPDLFPATDYYFEHLSAIMPWIKFEKPPKPLTGSDLARAMLEKGWKFEPCYVHDVSDDEAIDRKHYATVENKNPTNGYSFISTGETDWKYAVPIDPRTGEPLTESILND